MQQKPYHHGNLGEELVEAGISLINEEGIANFSLRKVAKRLGVSPTACYNHYYSKEELLEGMKHHVSERFAEVLLEASQYENHDYRLIEMGKAYVKFFADNPHYFAFIYDNEDYCIELSEREFSGDYKAFCIFKEVSIDCMKSLGVPKSEYHDNLIAMWAMVQGMAAMANMKGFRYKGDWGILTARILKNKIDLMGRH